MNGRDRLKRRQAMLRRRIAEHLDLVIGTLGKSPAMRGYNLTTKIKHRTVTRSVRKDLVRQVRAMTRRAQLVRRALADLSGVNWQLLRTSSGRRHR